MNRMDLLDTQLYGLIGEDGFRRLVAAFYRRVPGDDILGPMYPESDMAGAEERLRGFLIQRFGGPDDYSQRRGHPRLRTGRRGLPRPRPAGSRRRREAPRRMTRREREPRSACDKARRVVSGPFGGP